MQADDKQQRYEYIISKIRYARKNNHDELYNGYVVVLKKEFGLDYRRTHDEELLHTNTQ